jgi:hypothetical protein
MVEAKILFYRYKSWRRRQLWRGGVIEGFRLRLRDHWACQPACFALEHGA